MIAGRQQQSDRFFRQFPSIIFVNKKEKKMRSGKGGKSVWFHLAFQQNYRNSLSSMKRKTTKWNKAPPKLLCFNEVSRKEKVELKFFTLIKRAGSFCHIVFESLLPVAKTRSARRKKFAILNYQNFNLKSFVAFCYSAMNILGGAVAWGETFPPSRSKAKSWHWAAWRHESSNKSFLPPGTTIHFNWLSISWKIWKAIPLSKEFSLNWEAHKLSFPNVCSFIRQISKRISKGKRVEEEEGEKGNL